MNENMNHERALEESQSDREKNEDDKRLTVLLKRTRSAAEVKLINDEKPDNDQVEGSKG